MKHQLLMEFIDPPVVHVTTDYSQFKIFSYNRKIIHMSKFSKSVGHCNKLHLHPIIVSDKLEVIDGQHRLQYARDTGNAIYYVIDYNFHPSDLISHNITSSNWMLSDYCKFYATCDSETITDSQRREYRFILNVCQEYSISYEIVVKLFCKQIRAINKSNDFKKGILNLICSCEELLSIIILVDTIMTYLKNNKIIRSASLAIYSALYKITQSSGYDADRFLKKIEENLDLVVLALKFKTAEEVANRLLDIYNKHAKTKMVLKSKYE